MTMTMTMTMRSRVLFTAFVLLSFGGGGCGQGKKTAVAPEATADAAQGGMVLARLDGQPITDDDVRKVAGGRLTQAEMDLYEVRESAIRQVIDDKVLEAAAAKRGISKDDLVKKDVLDKIKVEEKDIQKFFNEKKDNFKGKKLEEVSGNIRSYLFREQQQKFYGKLVGDLKKKANVEMLITAPTIAIDEGDAPGIGPKDAPVRIVEWTDYQCPFCGRARPVVNQILSEYKGKVRYTLKDFPLSFHKNAQKAHEASHCANEQGKFWEMNTKLFGSQSELEIERLKKFAGELKLNQKKFDDCLDSGKFAELVQKNQKEGEAVGVSGTPAFFVNGRMLSGARPFEAFQEIIESELAKK